MPNASAPAGAARELHFWKAATPVITFRCAGCGGSVQANETAAGRRVLCGRCRHLNTCPTAPPLIDFENRPRHSSRARTLFAAGGALVIAALSWTAWSRADAGTPVVATSPIESIQRELLEKNLDKPGDPALGAMYQEIATRYFGGSLTPIPVRWEPGLAAVGPMAARAFTLQGMFGHVGSRAVILLNPEVADDGMALRRALCHEMVHAFLNLGGDLSSGHGPRFQVVLERLSREGAFAGIAATDEERTALRAWLDAESGRLDAERQDMERLGGDIERERADVEAAIADLDARLSAARAGTATPPSDTDIAAVATRRETYNRNATDANLRAERDRLDLEHFNREVARYNLMLVYPDGIEEHAMVRPKEHAPAARN